jgi:flagellar motility protein MotE (MotC chaperone)
VSPIRANAPAKNPGPAIAAAGTTNPGGDGAGSSTGAADAGAGDAGSAGAAPHGLWDAAMTPVGSTPAKKPGPLDALPPNATAAQQYCFNTSDSAAEARFAWQAKKIQEMEAELDKRSQQLEAKTQDYKRWLERRDEFSRKAHEKLVGFYSKMRPDAAALQLATINEEIAAAVLTKLDTKVASQIMGEMDPTQAAKIASLISGASKIPPEAKNKPGDQGGAKPPVPGGAAPPEQPRS